jgi:hypothetical protein
MLSNEPKNVPIRPFLPKLQISLGPVYPSTLFYTDTLFFYKKEPRLLGDCFHLQKLARQKPFHEANTRGAETHLRTIFVPPGPDAATAAAAGGWVPIARPPSPSPGVGSQGEQEGKGGVWLG